MEQDIYRKGPAVVPVSWKHRGVAFAVVEVEPGLWRWQFQIGVKLTTGTTKTKLVQMAVKRAQLRIDRELSKPPKWIADKI
jgi:hypothetical protein